MRRYVSLTMLQSVTFCLTTTQCLSNYFALTTSLIDQYDRCAHRIHLCDRTSLVRSKRSLLSLQAQHRKG